MKVKVLLLFSFLFGTTLFAGNVPVEKGDVLFTCSVTACNKMDSVFLFEFNGIVFKKIKTALTSDWQNYEFKVPLDGPRFYYVGLSAQNLRPVILGSESNVSLTGNCTSFSGAQLPGSNINKEYEMVLQQVTQFKSEFGTLLRQFQVAQSQDNVDQMNATVLQLRSLDQRRINYLDSLKNSNTFLSHIAALNTYLSYQNNGSGDLSEIEYFANDYFKFADWGHVHMQYMPQVYEGIRDFTQTLLSVGMPDEYTKHFLDELLSKIPNTSRTHMLALSGVMVSLQQQKKGDLLVNYAQRYIDLYRQTEPEAVELLEQVVRETAGFMPGSVAPDFAMAQPDGQPLKLSQLRGKYLLIDFWASWCGPCRVENPNVVKAYSQYAPKGFEILGVSLDQNRERWLDAITKDGLTWPQVSDLKGWQNEAAQLYGVSSIPHTFLLDKEGKIIARNLRGEALWAKLREVLGE